MSTYSVNTVLIERPTVYGNTTKYRVAEVLMPNVTTPVAGGAGQTVTVSVAFSEENLPADLNYCIEANASQACSVSWANKATTGFDIVLTPLTSGVTLSAGTVDVKVTWEKE